MSGFNAPQLVGYDDALMVVEMTIVASPNLLDFGKVWLARPADYSGEVLADWEQPCEELFKDDWPRAQGVLGQLEMRGIYYYDCKPANITVQ